MLKFWLKKCALYVGIYGNPCQFGQAVLQLDSLPRQNSWSKRHLPTHNEFPCSKPASGASLDAGWSLQLNCIAFQNSRTVGQFLVHWINHVSHRFGKAMVQLNSLHSATHRHSEFPCSKSAESSPGGWCWLVFAVELHYISTRVESHSWWIRCAVKAHSHQTSASA